MNHEQPAPAAHHEVSVQEITPMATQYYPNSLQRGSNAHSVAYGAARVEGVRYGEDRTTQYTQENSQLISSPDSIASAVLNGQGEVVSTDSLETQTDFEGSSNSTKSRVWQQETVNKKTGKTERQVFATRERTVTDPVTGETAVVHVKTNPKRAGRAALRLARIYNKERRSQEQIPRDKVA